MKPTVDRTYEKSDEAIFVALEDGEEIRFWLMGLTDDEYIRRAQLIQRQEKKNDHRRNV